ncbi:S8 family serine peptidase [Halolamina sp.]|uniref:S8 family serine peptidase n=1 Tax=Halolamina sp. TaxID=1940283 RepID=UPI00356A5D9D
MAPEATFSTFQIGKKQEGESKPGGNRGAVISAINDAADSGVDLLNMSIGIPHECKGRCSLSRETRYVSREDEVCPVVAAGNREPAGRLGIHCPAMCDEVLSVAGYLPYCEHEPVRTEDSGQWWLVPEDGKKLWGTFWAVFR